MAKKEFDKETTQQLGRAAAIEAMLESSGWSFAVQDLNEIVAELRDVNGIDVTRDDVAQQIIVNKAIAENLTQWVDDLKSQVNNAIILTDTGEKNKTIERR